MDSYIRPHPQFIERLRVESYLSAVPDVDVIARLHEFGLLPEDKRKRVVEQFRELAIETPDAGFLDESYRQLFTGDEFTDVLKAVNDDVLPNLDNMIDQWRAHYSPRDGSGDNDPDAYFHPLIEALENYREPFRADDEAVKLINMALADIDEVVSELRDEYHRRGGDDFYGDSERRPTRQPGRSIFDDVDA